MSFLPSDAASSPWSGSAAPAASCSLRSVSASRPAACAAAKASAGRGGGFWRSDGGWALPGYEAMVVKMNDFYDVFTCAYCFLASGCLSMFGYDFSRVFGMYE